MRRSVYQLFLLFLLYPRVGYTQPDIKKAWKDANPVKNETTILPADKIKLHEAYLSKAVEKNDITQKFYGNIYLYTDYMDEQNYPRAISYLLAAENLAKHSNNINWQGFVKLRTGWVAFIVHNDLKAAIKELDLGASLSARAKDSFCMAECFEQLSVMYSGLNEYDKSKEYFNLAMPVLRRSSAVQLDAAYNNFSGLLVRQGRLEEALLYIDSAIQIVREQKNKRREIFFLTNRALMLKQLKRYDSAEKIFKYCLALSTENKWMDIVMYDYEGLSENYHDKNNNAAAFEYLNKYHVLKDSLTGAEVQLKIAGLHANDEAQKKELALKKTQLELLTAKSVIAKRTWIIITSFIVLMFIVWMWYAQLKKEKRKQAHTKDNLEQLTRVLIEKNGLLADIEQKVFTLQEKSLADDASLEQYLHDKHELLAQITETKQDPNSGTTSQEQGDFETNIYNQRILTPSDWSAFKIYFEKAYPGYLLRLRNAYPSLTEAEERIFLFVKLSLTKKESAAILGISVDSVKKNRLRLRKRLQLDENTELDEFVKAF